MSNDTFHCDHPGCHKAAERRNKCGYCDLFFQDCGKGSHGDYAIRALRGHILKYHPEQIPVDVIDGIINDSRSLASVMRASKKDPPGWAAAMARIKSRLPSLTHGWQED